ncbi:MAG: cyclic nucleotide-binding domain-containing protein [Candidatus Cloacimonetes bacterium]|nr:cyclic nucleotide-binding domain-containing protein [Candidatus Cloacimonadota bacterium]MDY0337654.1 cyclic nucleotide-binding domain-containing protein [Candidatus Cloacimonadaceae bacterium]MCB5269904.1 cyclic nucleotide-binding domain-containing protein [Candidatus Cloacimonadota bacterium]MCK9334874.1 cyclic nucleotide-binding domain-containing protein [Candidatus Cloacimonadota bacterium]MDD2544159.1 cyclic nucleotide-binding domain-containing protein [Candidatus Cloacimonadota bacteri
MIDEKSIKRIRLFQALQEQDIRDLLPLLKPLSIPKGEYILREESYGDTISILVQGKVRVTKDLVKGFDEDLASTQKVIATLSADYLPTFGENGILGHAARNANVIAIEDCTLYTLNKEDFEAYAKNHYAAAFCIMQNIAMILSERLNSTDENLVKLATALYIAVQQ